MAKLCILPSLAQRWHCRQQHTASALPRTHTVIPAVAVMCEQSLSQLFSALALLCERILWQRRSALPFPALSSERALPGFLQGGCSAKLPSGSAAEVHAKHISPSHDLD